MKDIKVFPIKKRKTAAIWVSAIQELPVDEEKPCLVQ